MKSQKSMDFPVRDPEVWIPLHREYWNNILEPYGRACTDDMPVIVEHFKNGLFRIKYEPFFECFVIILQT